MNFVIRFATLLTLLALAACGDGSKDPAPPGDGGASNPPPPVVVAPSITTQPVDAVANEGGTVTFTVIATGDSLSYQWKKNGAAIAGATAASYTTPVLAAGDDQSAFTVTVTNAGGNVTSSVAKVTVTAAPPPPPPPSGDGPLQPLTGPADVFPHAAAPLAATPAISGVSPDHRHLLSWDPTSQGAYNFGFLHSSGAESRLSVPVASFLDELMISTADVTDIGPRVTRVIAALDIEPGDLVTEKTLTATFMIPDAMMATIDPAQLIGFAADSDGSNLHLVPLVVGNLGASVTRPGIKFDHLGIVGIAVATPEQQASLAAAWPTDPVDQLVAALAPSLTAKWRAAVGVSASNATLGSATTRMRIAAATLDDGVAPALRGYYNDSVVPAFAAADADISLAPAAISTGYSFLRMAALSGESGEGGSFAVVAAQVSARISALYDAYADHVASQCRALGGPPQLQQMLVTMRLLQLAGHTTKSDEIEADLPRCSSFKVSFRFEYTRTATWTEQYTAGDHSGTDTLREDGHAVIEGENNFGLNNASKDSPLHLTTLEWTTKRMRDLGGVSTTTWANENLTAPWRINGLSVPVVRTRGGTPPSSISMYLSPFVDFGPNSAVNFHPFTATTTGHMLEADGSEGPPIISPYTQIMLELFVPALPADGQHNYGPMLLPQTGNASSQRTRTTPLNTGSLVETESVTLTIARAE